MLDSVNVYTPFGEWYTVSRRCIGRQFCLGQHTQNVWVMDQFDTYMYRPTVVLLRRCRFNTPMTTRSVYLYIMYIGLYNTQNWRTEVFFWSVQFVVFCALLSTVVYCPVPVLLRMVTVAHFVVLCRLKCTFIRTYGRAYYTYAIHELLMR